MASRSRKFPVRYSPTTGVSGGVELSAAGPTFQRRREGRQSSPEPAPWPGGPPSKAFDLATGRVDRQLTQRTQTGNFTRRAVKRRGRRPSIGRLENGGHRHRAGAARLAGRTARSFPRIWRGADRRIERPKNLRLRRSFTGRACRSQSGLSTAKRQSRTSPSARITGGQAHISAVLSGALNGISREISSATPPRDSYARRHRRTLRMHAPGTAKRVLFGGLIS